MLDLREGEEKVRLARSFYTYNADEARRFAPTYTILVPVETP